MNFQYPPPLIPPRGEVNAADAFDIGSFDEEDTKGIKVYNFKQYVKKGTLTLVLISSCVACHSFASGATECARNCFQVCKLNPCPYEVVVWAGWLFFVVGGYVFYLSSLYFLV